MITDFEKLIAEVAKKNRYAPEPSDPIMVLVTIMNRIGEDHIAAMQVNLDHVKEQHAELADQWRRDAKASAEIILNTAFKAGRETMARAMSEGAEKVVALVRKETEEALAEQRVELTSTIANINRLCIAMTAITGLFLIIVTILAAMK